MKQWGTKILKFFVQSLIAELLVFGVMNKVKGKTVTGRKPKPKKKTEIKWNGNVIVGTDEYKVA
jgi:hypothetical protein